MSLQIFLAHTGQCLQADPISFSSPDALKSWIENQVSLPQDRQILITGRGKNVRPQNLVTETEVFVFDKYYISPSHEHQPSASTSPEPLDIQDPPATLANQTSLRAWRDLFNARKSWAVHLSESVVASSKIARQNLEEIEVIRRANVLALDNLQVHVRNIEGKLEDTKAWAKEALDEHETLLRDCQGNLDVLGKIPVKHDFGFLLHKSTAYSKKVPPRDNRGDLGTLRAFLDDVEVEEAASQLKTASHDFRSQLRELENAMAEISSDTRQLQSEAQPGSESMDLEEISNLTSDVETLTKKIVADYEEVLQLADTAKSIPIASRRALIHTRDLLPSLRNLALEMSQDAQKAVSTRNACLEASTNTLRDISVVQSNLGDFSPQISSLGLTADGMEAFDIVRSVFDIPIVYGSILVEAIQRNEWEDKFEANVERAREDMNTYREDEQRRRKKWAKSMSGLIADVQEKVGLGLEMSILRNDHSWPTSTRQDVFEYIDSLRVAQIDDAVQHVTALLKELDSSNLRKRVPRAFKNGSIYQADTRPGSSSVLLEDDKEPMRSLRSEKTRLEDKLRASDSRVRKLEDLLHRHSQMNRPASGNFGNIPSENDRPPPSPIGFQSPRPIELMSRRSSTSSRRPSSTQNPDERVYVQKIIGLEAELRSERDAVQRLQRDSHADRRASTESRDKMNEAVSTKKDLLANLDAQRQEFDDERQLLDDEIHKLKIKLEETEDELDRVLGSRDHLKVTSETNMYKLQNSLDRARNSGDAHDRHLQETKHELSSLQAQNLSLANQLRDLSTQQQELVSSLQVAHSHLSPAGSTPSDLGRLSRAIEILSEGMAIHARSTEEAAQLSAAENKSLEEQISSARSKLEQMRDQIANYETKAIVLRETSTKEQGLAQSLRMELKDTHQELDHLRTKFAAGETGSEALKSRVTQEEDKVVKLMEKLAIADSHTSSSEQEILIWKEKVSSLTEESRRWKDRSDVRGVRAKDLSQRLLSQNDRIVRMLEQMGYSVTRQNDQMVIQRASKVSASTILSGDTSTLMNRSLSGQSPIQHYSNAADLDTLYWMSDSDAISEDTKFQQFIATVSRLDTEAAADMISKRYKDVETLARKYQKDSRAYRERAHRLQSEAHDKIAYRSFKEGDLALFLPTRNQATRPWAAFNVGAPHYFLREQDMHKLQSRDWLLARISKVEERVVDLSKSLTNGQHQYSHQNPAPNLLSPDRRSPNTEAASDHGSIRSADDENPFELSDGLRWYMIDAMEEKPGTAPVLTPGLGKSTVAATNVDARGSIRLTKEGKKIRDSISGSVGGVGASPSATMATKTLSKSLDSRRSSSNSKKGHGTSPSIGSHVNVTTNTHNLLMNESAIAESSRPTSPTGEREGQGEGDHERVRPADSDAKADEQAREDAPIFEAVRKDLLFGP